MFFNLSGLRSYLVKIKIITKPLPIFLPLGYQYLVNRMLRFIFEKMGSYYIKYIFKVFIVKNASIYVEIKLFRFQQMDVWFLKSLPISVVKNVFVGHLPIYIKNKI